MKTKTKFLATFALLGGLFMASCNEEGRHQLSIVYPAQGYRILHADEVADSIMFVTFDSWKVTAYQSDWIRVTHNEKGTIQNDGVSAHIITSDLQFAPNATRHSRIGWVTINSYEYQVGAKYLQYGHLDINRPSAKAETFMSGSTIPDSVSFCLADSSYTTADSLCFRVQNHWELEFVDEQPEWISADKMYGHSGRNRVNLTFQANPDTTARRTKVRLTSGRVSNDIEIVQHGRKKEFYE